MRTPPTIMLFIAAACVAPVAMSQSQATLNTVISNDIVMVVQGADIPIDYHADGTYSGEMEGTGFSGNWRIDGASLCTRSLLSQTETCTEFPPGKKPGDVFNVVNPALGEVTIRINERSRARG